MCVVCVNYNLGKMSSKEAFRAIGEIIRTEKDPQKIEHAMELSSSIMDDEIPLDQDEVAQSLEDLDPETYFD